jgi:hypothetical protein
MIRLPVCYTFLLARSWRKRASAKRKWKWLQLLDQWMVQAADIDQDFAHVCLSGYTMMLLYP